MSDPRTKTFFDIMSRTYDRDIREIGWNPTKVIKEWPFVVMPGESIVDAGCGTGHVLEYFSGANRTLIGFDLSKEMIAQARQRNSLKDPELFNHSVDESWPIQDRTVDRVVCIAVLEFVEHIERVFDEIHRVLRPGGSALISVEAVVDARGRAQKRHALRYGELPLWRRSEQDVEMALPLGLRSVRYEVQPAYRVDETNSVCAYRFAELQREYSS